MPKKLWLVIIGMVINVTGASFLWPLNTIYIYDHLGKTLSLAGLVLMLNAGAGVVGNLIGGALFDRIGAYKTILAGILLTTVAAFILIFFHTFTYYVLLMVVLGFGSGVLFPAMYALAGAVWPEGGRKPFNALYVAQNLGVALGAAIGGLIASFDFKYIFIGNTVMYGIFFVLALVGFKHMLNAEQKTGVQTSILKERFVIKNKTKLIALLILCFGYFLCWIGYVQWQTTIAAYTQDIGISLKQYSLLWAINGALIVLGQPLISYIVNKWMKTFKMQIMFGMVIFIVSYFVAATAEQFSIFVTAMVILTIGEMFVWPAVPTVASELAPKGREGFYQGIVNSTATGGRMIGPVLGGVIVDLSNMTVLFYGLIILFGFALFTTSIYDRKIKTAAIPAQLNS